MFRHKLIWAVLCIVLTAAFAFAQSAPKLAGTPADPNAYVHAQFGPLFHLVPGYAPITGDIDGDGTEDIVLVATAKDPLIDQTEFHFKTIDPYNAFFGWSDPRDTSQFSAQEGDPRYLLIVHDWRAATPKAKFAAINLQFEKLSLSRFLTKKKKVVPAIELEDRTGLTSDLYWDGKQWKWEDRSLK